jgi:hypothetical protein
MKPKKSSSKYKVRCEAFIFQRKNETLVKIQSQRSICQNTKSCVKLSFLEKKQKIAKPSSKDKAKVRRLHQNMKPKKPSSKYEVRCEAFIFTEKMKK